MVLMVGIFIVGVVWGMIIIWSLSDWRESKRQKRDEYWNPTPEEAEKFTEGMNEFVHTPKADKHVVNDVVPAGVIRRPDVREIQKRNEPKPIREAKEEMKKSLDQIPELQKAKRDFKKYS